MKTTSRFSFYDLNILWTVPMRAGAMRESVDILTAPRRETSSSSHGTVAASPTRYTHTVTTAAANSVIYMDGVCTADTILGGGGGVGNVFLTGIPKNDG
jgi:hypothetical protein